MFLTMRNLMIKVFVLGFNRKAEIKAFVPRALAGILRTTQVTPTPDVQSDETEPILLATRD